MKHTAHSILDTQSGAYYPAIDGRIVSGEAGSVAHDTSDDATRHAAAILIQYGHAGVTPRRPYRVQVTA